MALSRDETATMPIGSFLKSVRSARLAASRSRPLGNRSQTFGFFPIRGGVRRLRRQKTVTGAATAPRSGRRRETSVGSRRRQQWSEADWTLTADRRVDDGWVSNRATDLAHENAVGGGWLCTDRRRRTRWSARSPIHDGSP